jgi:Protein of unknown function (DUF3987)
MATSTLETNGLADYLDRLELSKGGKYICPACDGNDLSIYPSGGHQCHNNGCSQEQIKKALGVWVEYPKGPMSGGGGAPFVAPQQRRKSRRDRDKDAIASQVLIEQKIQELVYFVEGLTETAETAGVALAAWCKQHDYDGFTAGQMLRAKLRELAAAKPELGLPTGNVTPIRPGVAIAEPEEVSAEEVGDLLWRSSQVSNPAALLPTLYPHLAERAAVVNAPAICFVSQVLPIAASCLPSQARLQITKTHWVPAILWIGVVGESGTAKSLTIDTAANPLRRLQNEHHTIYRDRQAEYEADLKQAKKLQRGGDNHAEEPEAPPPLRHFYSSDFTIESLSQILSKQPDLGLAVTVDELAGFFRSFGEYKGGGGSDRQKWLSMYGGGGIKTDRKNAESQIAARTSTSIGGTIQPSTLAKLIGNPDEVDGLWPRFMFFSMPTTEIPAPDYDRELFNIGDLLYNCYIRLSALQPQTYTLSHDARALWTDWHRWAEGCKMAASSEAIQAIYPKAREQAARVALVAHCLEAVANNQVPTLEISVTTLQAAIEFTKVSIETQRQIFGVCDATEDSPEAIRMARFVARFDGQTIAWLQVRNQLPRVPVPNDKPRRANKSECVTFLRRVCELGYGVDAGSGDYSKINVEMAGEFAAEFVYDAEGE